MSPRGKYRTLPLKEKLAAIQEVDAGVKKTEVALKYGLTKSTLTTILKAKDKLQNNASRFAPDRKRLREAAYPDLENAVLLWLKRARSSNLPINGPILREKAEELFLRLGIEDFKCSDGWISRFKERHGLSFKTTEGDDESQVLSALKAHNIAADLDSYAATDDNLCVCREDTLDDLVAEVLPAQHSSESEEEPEVENVTTAQAFQYIAKVFTYNAKHDRLELCFEPYGHFAIGPDVEAKIASGQVGSTGQHHQSPTTSPTLAMAASVSSTVAAEGASIPAESSNTAGSSSDEKSAGVVSKPSRTVVRKGPGFTVLAPASPEKPRKTAEYEHSEQERALEQLQTVVSMLQDQESRAVIEADPEPSCRRRGDNEDPDRMDTD
ncbi:hypothetical protein HPB51_007832 [Rhipicephalus microplus]|uniref:Tick transposon n=1 Tax=Rhipicephalus microplus TaxID=6941 RepID=A0A9J6END2_RHIMP|nr:hypothetical protein HPB51_007832 [Rhipicephalus microplus]